MCQLIFKMFCNVAHVPISCKLNIFFFLFYLSFLLITIICIGMLYMFQRVESIHEMPAGFSLEYQNMNARYIFNINTLSSLHTVLYYRIVFTNSYLMVCFQTLKKCWMQNKNMRCINNKEIVQPDTLLLLQKQLGEPTE